MAELAQIFISYARRDGRDLARRLHADLTRAGHTVWLDTADIDGGASWSEDIEAAIEGCEVTLALLTPGAFVSEICRAEHLRALRKGKRLVPLLAQPDAERPLYLEHLHFRDFSLEAAYETELESLLRDLASGLAGAGHLPEHSRRTFTNAPRLPEKYIPRPEELSRLRQVVLGDETDRHVALTAVQGMGGIGKSVLAAALCHDPVVQDAFPDGVVWVEIGREPGGLAGQMRLLGQALGDAAGYYDSEMNAASRLREMLPGKAALIVLDDVWEAAQVEPFLSDAPRGRVLFTTRDSGIGLGLGAEDVRLDVLPAEQSVTLLREWAGRHEEEFAQLAERLGHLPLALKLAGARLREGMSAATWLQTFQSVAQMKMGRRARRPQDNLQVCFDLSVQQLAENDRLLYHTLGIFPEDIWIPVSVVRNLWRSMQPSLGEFDCDELLTDLGRLALVEYDAGSGSLALHDLLHDYTRAALGEGAAAAHDALLKAYVPDSKGWAPRDWATLPDDGYVFRHLGHHMRGAGRRADFIRLLTSSPDWLEAVFRATGGDTAYVAEVEQAISDYADPLAPSDLPALVALHLARHVVTARADRYTDQDLLILTLLGRTEEALSVARLRGVPKARTEGLLTVYRALEEIGQPKTELLEEVAAVAAAIPTGWQRAVVLSQVAGQWIQAGELARAEDIAGLVETTYLHVQLLCQLARAHLRQEHGLNEKAARRLLTQAQAMAYTHRSVEPLCEVATAYARLEDSATAREMLDAAHEVAADAEKREAGAASFESNLVLVVRTLAEAGFPAQAVHVTNEIHEPDIEAAAWSRIGTVLGNEDRHEEALLAFQSAIAATEDIQWDILRDRALRGICLAMIKAGYHDGAADAIPLISDARDRSEALQRLALGLAKAGRIHLAIVTADEIEAADYHCAALAGLARELHQRGHADTAHDLFSRVEEIAVRVMDTLQRKTSYYTLAEALAECGLFEAAERVASQLDEPSYRARTLREVAARRARQGHHDDATRLVNKVARLVASTTDTHATRHARDQLALGLVKAGAIDAARILPHTVTDLDALREMVDILGGRGHFGQISQRINALSTAIPGDSTPQQQSLQCDFTRVLAENGLIEKAHIAARRVTLEPFKSGAFGAVATHMAHRGQQREALYLARTLPPGDNMARVHVSIALAQYAGGQGDAASSTLIGAAKRLIGAENPLERAHALSILAAGLTQVGRDDRAGDYFAEAFRLVRAADDGHDPDAALALARVAEQMAAVNRQKQARDLYELATRDVTPFWPEAGEMFTRMNVALKHIAISAGRSGFPDLAATAADYMLTSERRNPAFREIASALAEAGHIEDGINLLDKMTVAVERDLARADLARVLAARHHFDRATEIIAAIQDPATAARARCQLAVAYQQQGADDKASEMFARVAGLLSQAEEDPFSEKEQQAVRRAYASALAECGQVAQAMRVLGPQKLDDVLALVGAWLPHLRGTSRNRALDVVREATRVAGWVRPDWGDVYAVLRG